MYGIFTDPRRLLLLPLIVFSVSLLGAAPLKESSVHVIIYHTFLGKERVSTDFSVDELREHMERLKGQGYRFVTIAEMERGAVSGTRNVLVCIDDGNKSVYRAYREVLGPMGIKPLLAIYPNIIGRRKYALTWDELRALAADGCEIAAHGFFHLHVNDKLYAKNRPYFMDEIHKSKRVLEEKMGRPVTVFVYPSGEKSGHAMREIRAAGYRYAFTINWGTLKLPLDRNASPYELPRYMLVRGNWKNIFALMDKKSGRPGGNGLKGAKRHLVRSLQE